MSTIQHFKCESCGDIFEQSIEGFSFGESVLCEECYSAYCEGLFEQHDVEGDYS